MLLDIDDQTTEQGAHAAAIEMLTNRAEHLKATMGYSNHGDITMYRADAETLLHTLESVAEFLGGVEAPHGPRKAKHDPAFAANIDDEWLHRAHAGAL